jgi:hypothetical protein
MAAQSSLHFGMPSEVVAENSINLSSDFSVLLQQYFLSLCDECAERVGNDFQIKGCHVPWR